jgi:hypothetical protein
MQCLRQLHHLGDQNHITCTLPNTLDSLQFAYRPNISTADAIGITLHTALSHLDKRNIYVGMLFIDYTTAFNTIVHSKVIINLRLGLNPALCTWVLDYLMGRPQVVKVGNNTFTSCTPCSSMTAWQRMAMQASNTIIKFADDTAVVGLITNNDETA